MVRLHLSPPKLEIMMDLKITGNVLIKHKKMPDCEWCDKAKELLESKDIPFTTIESDKKLFGELFRLTKSGKLPQIIMDGKYIGQYNELEEYLNN
tara:strand:+ start:4873 stop:5157 length:285 start_codon:yes stop_codon:yes gene_type:complete